jgi:hypothetical protein
LAIQFPTDAERPLLAGRSRSGAARFDPEQTIADGLGRSAFR